MKAAVINNFVQSWNELDVINVAKPAVRPGHVLVKIKVAAGNPVEKPLAFGYLAGNGWKTPFPYTLGEDFAGVVEEVGSDVTAFTAGDAVFAMNWGQSQPHDNIENPLVGGAFAEYILIPAHKLSKIPTGVSFENASVLGVVGTTAHQGVVQIGQVTTGTRILILGGSSSVGIVAIQLAKSRGAHVITTASSRTFGFVSTLGADKVINYNETNWENDPELKGVDVVFDTVGEKDGLQRAVNSGVVKSNGVFASIADFSLGWNPAGHPPLSFGAVFSVRQNTAAQDELVQLVLEGKIKIPIDEKFPFSKEGVIALLHKIESGKSVGKNLLVIT